MQLPLQKNFLLDTMKITYDEDADAMYIKLIRGKVAKTKEVDPNMMVDYDSKGNILGIEILFVKELMPSILKDMQNIEVEVPA